MLTSPDRRDSDSIKWKLFAKPGKDILPMWVADMDFTSPQPVLDAMHERIDHGVFGYSLAPDSLTDTVTHYLKRQHGQSVQARALVWLPGLVPALSVVSRAVGEPDDEVMIMTPVYAPFFSAPADGGKQCIEAPLARDEVSGTYHIDLETLERKVTPKTKLLVLCNPHNPVGRAFSYEEVEAVATFCAERDIILCSDEIHCDLILDDIKHTTAIQFEGHKGLRTITLMAPSKTYNIAGLGLSYAVIPDASLRTAFRKAMGGYVPHPSPLSYVAAEAAYKHGEPWRQELLTTLRANRDLLEREINAIPGLRMAHLEATYLAWIDCSELKIDPSTSLHSFFLDQAGIAFSKGSDYGDSHFIRMNFGCPTSTVEDALDRMRKAIGALGN
ncbi:MalY/PatB family protein [Sulfuriroseicoccus oceanibius]|uniref:cysteine-S-conjugate beta-lyase n=1 Tax=Sulfuriroseicoccus oceanibius TaxID=2707525 RepID=A0A6B3LEY7_9BACT|nr:PatB family C-S lyase [Sulfuriroseicoccus oceanibius]QQL45079.1 PatB family C-S lyase [Sulfuriroseicoccus oceanibius]